MTQEDFDILKKVITKFNKTTFKNISNSIRASHILDKIVLEENLNNYLPIFREIRRDRLEIHKCKICRKPIESLNRIYCSRSCYSNDPECIIKRSETCKKLYGVEYVSQLQESKEKHRTTCLKKYGVDSFTKTAEYIEKTKKTNRKKYGTDWSLQNECIKNKAIQTNIEKYGVDNPNKCVTIRNKIKKTNLEKTGTINGHGIETVATINRNLKEKNYDNIQKAAQKKGLYLSMKKQEFITSEYHIFECTQCNDKNIWKWPYKVTKLQVFCPRCYATKKSIGEFELKQYILKFVDKDYVKFNDRKILNGKELDIYIEKYKLAFEFNGDFWHANPDIYKSDDIIKIPNSQGLIEEFLAKELWEKDIWKYNECNKKNVKLVTIWQKDWIIANKETKQKIRKLLNEI